jgi:hypothetical protein
LTDCDSAGEAPTQVRHSQTIWDDACCAKCLEPQSRPALQVFE